MITKTWTCQHGTRKDGYTTPTANCPECKSAPCEWRIADPEPSKDDPPIDRLVILGFPISNAHDTTGKGWNYS